MVQLQEERAGTRCSFGDAERDGDRDLRDLVIKTLEQHKIGPVDCHKLAEEQMARQGSLPKLLGALGEMDQSGVFQEKSHDKSKYIFQAVMRHLGLGVTYVNAEGSQWVYTGLEIEDSGTLDSSIFYWHTTTGVENDIPEASRDESIHLFTVASQYNAAEALDPHTPCVGKAMEDSKKDNTQGPLAQRTNPIIFEVVNAFLANLSFNMLERVLPAGSHLEHGYLRPDESTVKKLGDTMCKNYAKIECPCYESKPRADGESVYLMLGAAPALAYAKIKHLTETCQPLEINTPDFYNLEYWAYLGSFSTQFKQALFLIKAHPDKKVVLHITGTGIGVFGCHEEIFTTAFKKAAAFLFFLSILLVIFGIYWIYSWN